MDRDLGEAVVPVFDLHTLSEECVGLVEATRDVGGLDRNGDRVVGHGHGRRCLTGWVKIPNQLQRPDQFRQIVSRITLESDRYSQFLRSSPTRWYR